MKIIVNLTVNRISSGTAYNLNKVDKFLCSIKDNMKIFIKQNIPIITRVDQLSIINNKMLAIVSAQTTNMFLFNKTNKYKWATIK